ncbi:MAG: hypothetical protein COU90_01470 [Candidatus Ryanbacteria bacterium CG10_big_fil_rev_8_21_14_0_10_43_42]|uniref:Nudix hydrolase domain-containing protein n=1 Tax=Candidatus Ryanbacteria bacterium CG10_big_fil_rev_8_21_14_0_10_43_42 TaxID=1974864 RepID=A0A2M8KX34_9BACT|nr:MAG: hypothetical protein COU90_01470 [Candidatus Ryanbacteria bacterium CG10_big_fil_rev_8_21_14_0_10_43_42]
MSTQFTHRFLDPAETLPLQENVSAVFLVAFQGSKILAAKNERTWDVPGGHREGDEDSLVALQREVLEEAGAYVRGAVPYAVLTSSTSTKVMLFFASNNINLVKFVPSEDALERELLDPEELLRRYNGDKDLLKSLIKGAQRMLGLP